MKENIQGSAGSSGPIKPNYAPEDFKEGYVPHLLCTYGAVCEECGSNLIKTKNQARI